MSWIHVFEIMCYVIVGIMLIDLIRKKDYNNLFTFGSAAIVGFIMELLAVAVTDIYYYNPNFYLNIGLAPKQFPFFGGLMWGGLTVYGMKLAEKFKLSKVKTSLIAGTFIVTMDILLDVVAIRLDGGFWVWVGKDINFLINQHTFMSVIWVNFLGYMIETPTVVWLTLNKREKVKEKDFKKQFKEMFLIAFKAILVTIIGSLLALGLNMVTNDWFSCITFIILWSSLIIMIIYNTLKKRMKIDKISKWNIPMLIFWSAMYIYCISAIIHLKIYIEECWFLVMGITFTLFTIYISIAKPAKN